MAGKKERQRKLARQRYERRLTRQAQRDQRARKWTIGVTAAVVVVAIAVGGFFFASRSKSPSATPKASASATPSPSPTTVAEPATHCVYTANPPAARKVTFPSATPDDKATYQATVTTNRGPIVIDRAYDGGLHLRPRSAQSPMVVTVVGCSGGASGATGFELPRAGACAEPNLLAALERLGCRHPPASTARRMMRRST